MKFKIFSVEINVSFFFFAFLTIMLIIDKTGFVLPVFLSTAIHEAGHLLAMLVFKCHPKKINLIPGSIQIVRGFCVKRQGEIFILISGPLANLTFSAVSFLFFYFTGLNWLLTFSAINILVFAFNLLPLKGLDGGGILRVFLQKIVYGAKTEIILDVVSILCGTLAVFLGVSGIMAGKTNLSLAILGLYIIASVIVKL